MKHFFDLTGIALAGLIALSGCAGTATTASNDTTAVESATVAAIDPVQSVISSVETLYGIGVTLFNDLTGSGSATPATPAAAVIPAPATPATPAATPDT